MCQEPWHSLAGDHWLRVCNETIAKMLAKYGVSSEDTTVCGRSSESVSKFTHMAAGRLGKIQFQIHSCNCWQASVPDGLAVGLLDWELQFLIPFYEAAHNMVTSSFSMSSQREQRKERVRERERTRPRESSHSGNHVLLTTYSRKLPPITSSTFYLLEVPP